MKTTRVQVPVGMILMAGLMLATACTHSRKISRRTSLLSDYNVEYRHGARILTLVLGRNGVHYSFSEHKLTPAVLINEKVESGHWFEIGISGSCRLVGPAPEKLVLDLTHGVTNGRIWTFPSPMSSSDLGSPNASFDVVVLADGYAIKLPRHYQGELKKVSPSDATSYEAIITEISREDFDRIANSRAVTVQFASLASFDLDDETIAALKDFATTLSGAKQ